MNEYVCILNLYIYTYKSICFQKYELIYLNSHIYMIYLNEFMYLNLNS